MKEFVEENKESEEHYTSIQKEDTYDDKFEEEVH
jgi:hypothetical protein